MTETILMGVLEGIGAGVAGNFTWDVIKTIGSKLLDLFKDHFVHKGHFSDEQEAENFFKDISSKELLNKRRPLADICAIYDNCTGREASELFKKDFNDWIRAHGEEFERLGTKMDTSGGISIGQQIVRDNAKVHNIGIQYNNYSGFKDGH